MNDMKKVINVGGTSRSGSTLLSSILANDENSLYLGEIHAIFFPTRVHHHKRIQEIKKDKNWATILDKGVNKCYSKIFELYKKNFIVDSSKNSEWIKNRNKDCAIENLEYKNILIYKTPKEMANSYLKRGLQWERNYINYHKKYFSLIEEFYVISYRDLVENDQAVKQLCNWIGIEFFETKKKYWNSPEALFFGSSTPKDKKELRYDSPSYFGIDELVQDSITQKPSIKKVWDFLESKNGKVCTIVPDNLTYNSWQLFYFKSRNLAKKFFRKLKPEDYFENKDE